MRIGDSVKITNLGKIYSTYEEWIEKYCINRLTDYAYGLSPRDTSVCFKIVCFGNKGILLIEDPEGHCYMIHRSGVRAYDEATELDDISIVFNDTRVNRVTYSDVLENYRRISFDTSSREFYPISGSWFI